MKKNSEMPQVSIIIPTRNRSYLLGWAIRSCINQTYKNLEIIIVDDHSHDNTREIVEKIANSNNVNLKYIRNKRHLGLPAARNIGLRHARGELIFFSEDDLILTPNTIEILVKTYFALSTSFKIGAIAPRLILKSSTRLYTPIVECGKIIGIFNELTGDHCANYDVHSNHILLSEHPPATSLIPRQVFKEVGDYYTGYKYNYLYEDSDLYYRLLKKGYILIYQPKAVAYHISGNPGGCTINTLKKYFADIYNLAIFNLRMFRISGFPRTQLAVLKKIGKLRYIKDYKKQFEKISIIDKIGFYYSYSKLLRKYRDVLIKNLHRLNQGNVPSIKPLINDKTKS